MYHIVYKTSNTVNDTIYIGVHSTRNLEDNYIGSGTLLWRAIDKHGANKFSRIILQQYDSRDLALLGEIDYIKHYTDKGSHLYNLTMGGDGTLGWHPTDEVKAKISDSLRGRKLTEEHRAHIGEGGKGRKDSPETCKKRGISISAALLGRSCTDEHKKNVSLSLIGNTRALGMIHTDASKQQMSLSNKMSWTEDRRQAMSDRMKGHTYNVGRLCTNETKANMSEAKKGNTNKLGYKEAQSTKDKKSAAQKLYWKGNPNPKKLSGFHRRWHTNRGKHNNTCKYCLLECLLQRLRQLVI